jgi:ABC-type sugar transport system ATPase subunit
MEPLASPDGGHKQPIARPIARLAGVEKTYPGVRALKGVDFDVLAGEVHCLVGENGAGKSTLMRVLTGAVQPDAGRIEIDGAVTVLDPASAIRHGIGIVYQELDLIPAMSIAENIFLGHEPMKGGGVIDFAALTQRTAEFLASLDLALSPATKVRDLSPAHQQMVQIAKALSHKNRLLILDEPTASLTSKEVEHLFVLIRKLRAQGLGIVYISHRLEEVLALGDRITVFRDGNHIVTRPVAGMTQPDIIKAMVGRSLDDQFPKSERHPSEELLSVKGLTRKGEFHDVSFSLRKGEVLAIAGIIGAGRSELLETIFGIRKADSGTITIDGKVAAIHSPRDAIRLGLGLVPEERRESGLVLGRSVGDNLIFAMVDRLGSLMQLQHGPIRQTVDKFIKDLSIKTPSGKVLAGSLSGGNQQKIVIGKWLAAGVKILLLDEPTRGVDVNAKAEIYRLIDELVQAGVGIVVVSSELPEVLGISDRVIVLSHGAMTATLETASTGQEEIMHYAVASAPALEAAQ